MPPAVCPNCRELLATKYGPYEKGLRKILEENTLEEVIQEKRAKLVKELVPMDCCTTHMLTYIHPADIVK